jgi:rRNA-processing protein FCF1
MFGKIDERYLVDTNIVIYAENHDLYLGEHCKQVFMAGSGMLATTEAVIEELSYRQRENVTFMHIYSVKDISPEVEELHYDTEQDLSLADKSLIQCAIDHPEIAGIITYDKDIKNVVPTRLIKSEKQFFIGTAEQFLKKKNRL